jgi:hypothetical protein
LPLFRRVGRRFQHISGRLPSVAAQPCFHKEDAVMSEFLLAEQLTAKLNLTESELPQFEAQGIIKPVTKNGHIYYSSRDFYRLKGVLFFMRDQGLSLEDAQDRLANWDWFSQSAGAAAAR